MSDKNKMTKEEFLALDTAKQLKLVNDVLENGKTEDVSKNFDFSYSWLSEKFNEKGIFYAGSIKRFIIEDRVGALTDRELSELRGLIVDYKAFKNSNNLDIRLCAGQAGNDTVTKSIVINKDVNDIFNEFSKKNSYISAKDMYTVAIKEFVEKYDRYEL